MHDNESGHMSAIALEAQSIVRKAAEPVPAGMTVKGQLRMASRALGYPEGFWRVRAAWHGEAGCWSASALEDLRARFRRWQDKQNTKARAADLTHAARLEAVAAALESKDADFYRTEAESLRDLAHRIVTQDRT
jgi:hypothetical protein